MKEDTKIALTVSLLAAFLVFVGFMFGQTYGYGRGMKTAQEIHDKVECEFDYGYKPASEIPGRCMKYFKDK